MARCKLFLDKIPFFYGYNQPSFNGIYKRMLKKQNKNLDCACSITVSKKVWKNLKNKTTHN